MPELFENSAAIGMPRADDGGERVDAFRARFHEYAAARLTLEDLPPQVEIDALLEFREINERSVAEISAWRRSAAAIRRRYSPRWTWRWLVRRS